MNQLSERRYIRQGKSIKDTMSEGSGSSVVQYASINAAKRASRALSAEAGKHVVATIPHKQTRRPITKAMPVKKSIIGAPSKKRQVNRGSVNLAKLHPKKEVTLNREKK